MRSIEKIIILLLLFTLAASCRMGGVIQVTEFPDQEASPQDCITVVNWNVQKGENRRLTSDLKALIEQYHPDIVFLQEAKADLLQTKEMGGYFAKGWKYPWPGGDTVGVITFSRMLPIKVESLHSMDREFGVTAPKVSLITEHMLPNGEILLALNVHLLNFERWDISGFSSQLDGLKSRVKKHPGPVLISGDFNTWNMKRQALVQEVTRELGLTEVTDFPPGRRTGDLHSSSWNQAFGVDKEIPLDRIYYRGFGNHSADVLAYDSSDHRPILVKIHFTGGASQTRP